MCQNIKNWAIARQVKSVENGEMVVCSHNAWWKTDLNNISIALKRDTMNPAIQVSVAKGKEVVFGGRFFRKGGTVFAGHYPKVKAPLTP